MSGFQTGNIDAIRVERVVCTVKIGDARWKVFQIFFGKDRSLFITFPYYRHREGLLCASEVPPSDALNPQQINLAIGGKATSHLVKYSHHPDGRAHFPQTGKTSSPLLRMACSRVINKDDTHSREPSQYIFSTFFKKCFAASDAAGNCSMATREAPGVRSARSHTPCP